MKTNKTRLFALLLALTLFSALCLTGCGNGENSEGNTAASSTASTTAVTKDAKVLSAAIMNTAKLPEMLEASDRVIQNYYGLDEAQIESASVYVTSSGATADEIAVFVLKADADSAAALQLLQKRITDQIASFTGYVDSEVPRLQSAKVGQIGNVLYLICTDDATAGESALKGAL